LLKISRAHQVLYSRVKPAWITRIKLGSVHPAPPQRKTATVFPAHTAALMAAGMLYNGAVVEHIKFITGVCAAATGNEYP